MYLSIITQIALSSLSQMVHLTIIYLNYFEYPCKPTIRSVTHFVFNREHKCFSTVLESVKNAWFRLTCTGTSVMLWLLECCNSLIHRPILMNSVFLWTSIYKSKKSNQIIVVDQSANLYVIQIGFLPNLRFLRGALYHCHFIHYRIFTDS